jgi:hypothetical protein
MGFDSFPAFMAFVITLGIELIVYFCIHVFLQEWMLPLIGKGLAKIPYFRDRIKESPITIVAKKEISNTQIREEHLQAEVQRRNNTLTIATQYTQAAFAPYLSDSELIRLCDCIALYAEGNGYKNLPPVKVNDNLTPTDIYHFGWNIWHHFGVGKQIDVAYFLKTVFQQTLRDVEVESIKKHLKDDELKGNIKIKEDISQ